VIAAVVVRNASDQLHARALATLRALLPHVGIDAPGIYACDLAGTERVLGAPSRVARRIVERLARVSAPAAVAVAITPFAARVAAERTADGDVRLVTEPREYLAPLPLEVLPIDPKLVDELGLLGMRSVGDFAALPLVSREQLVFALKTSIDDVSGALGRDGLAALRIAVRLEREDADPLRLERAILPPTRESAALLRSVRWALEERAHLGRIVGCVVEVREAEPARGRQIGLFAADGARWEEAIASARYLRERLGPGRVLRARVTDADARLPERAAEWKEVIA
jgi:hypothetical protein